MNSGSNQYIYKKIKGMRKQKNQTSCWKTERIYAAMFVMKKSKEIRFTSLKLHDDTSNKQIL